MIFSINLKQQKMGGPTAFFQHGSRWTGKKQHWILTAVFLLMGLTSVFGGHQHDFPPTQENALINAPSAGHVLPDTFPDMDKLDAVESEFLLSAASPEFFTLSGTTRDAFSNELVRGIKLEVNQMSDTGLKKLVFTGAFYKGQISVALKRGFNYQLRISKQDYHTRVIDLEPKDIHSDERMIEREFILQKTEKIARAEVPDEAPAADTTEKGVDTASHRLTKATSLRQAPNSKARVILRFAPDDEVKVLEKTNQWWWKVRFKEQTGYAKALLLSQEIE